MPKRALVCGAGGFIGGHLVKRLKSEGYWVRGVDIREHAFTPSVADEFLLLDLRNSDNCRIAVTLPDGPFDEVYQLAADMGGMGFISSAECAIMHNNSRINLLMTQAAVDAGVLRYFFSSSVCVYRDMAPGEPELSEEAALPAHPDNEYGWEKLYSERVALTYARHYPMQVRIGRFQNCYGPESCWYGGREKAPAAISRKVAEVDDGGSIEVWGDGSAVRCYTYIDDLISGIRALMESDLQEAVNVGSSEYVTLDELVATIAEAAGKKINVKHVEGPVGVRSRNFSNAKISSTGWRATTTLKDGIRQTYTWVEAQVIASRHGEHPEPVNGADSRH
jgi:GDP-D-mannose 3', 5'-epimerase